jgi:hypothetical protein
MSSARALRDAIEPFHAVCYFAPEIRHRYVDELGQHPWAAYFAQRAAPMGAVTAPLVAATFYGFSPRLVSRSIPSVWQVISPAEATTHRLEATAIAIRRLLGRPDVEMVDRANDLAGRALAGCDFAGRPLSAAHADIEPSDDPLIEVWRRVAVLREYRGDGHVTALVHAGVGPIESLMTARGFGDFTPESYRKLRGWSEEEWEAGLERCQSAGWIDDALHLTDAGTAIRWEIEAETDRLFEGPLEALGQDGVEELTEIVGTMSRAISGSGEVK